MFSNSSIDGVFVMPKEVLKYASGAKKSELKVIMYLFANKDGFDIEKAARELSETPESINACLAFWRGTGIICDIDEDKILKSTSSKKAQDRQKAQETADNLPETKNYSADEIATARDTDKEFDEVVEFIQSVVGNLLNSTKASSILYLYRNLGMQSDVIIGVAAYCQSIGKNKLQYIVGTAESIHKDGVVTYKELESYLSAKQKYAQFESAVKRIIGAGDRALTSAEKKALQTWEKEYCIGTEIVEVAYERTISVISKPSIPYMNKIIENWVNSGIKTAEEARKQLEEQGVKLAQKKKDGGIDDKAKKAGFDIDIADIFEKP